MEDKIIIGLYYSLTINKKWNPFFGLKPFLHWALWLCPLLSAHPQDPFWLCLCLWVFGGQGRRSRPWTKRCVSRSTECSNVYSDVVALEMDINDLTACLWGQAQRDTRGQEKHIACSEMEISSGHHGVESKRQKKITAVVKAEGMPKKTQQNVTNG